MYARRAYTDHGRIIYDQSPLITMMMMITQVSIGMDDRGVIINGILTRDFVDEENISPTKHLTAAPPIAGDGSFMPSRLLGPINDLSRGRRFIIMIYDTVCRSSCVIEPRPRDGWCVALLYRAGEISPDRSAVNGTRRIHL